MKLKYVFVIILLALSSSFFAQLPPGGPGGPGCWPPPCVPIDGGITIFSIIAAAFGYRFLSKNK